ncbi:MAG: outer membrane beta-barrel protein [bacterium]
MKKVLTLLAVFVLSLAAIVPAYAIEGTSTVSTKDLLAMSQKKSYRLGVRLSMISPNRDVLATKTTAYDLGLEFDARLNQNLDTGPRFGLSSFNNDQGTTLNATYSILRFGYGARMYVLSWGDSSAHGIANLYLDAEANYYTANKSSEVKLNSPSSFAGFGAQIGTGIEFGLGPDTGAFAQINYLRTSIKDSSGNSLPLDGFILAAGARMAFF